MSKIDKTTVAATAKRILSYGILDKEDLAIVGKNTSTNLSPRMRLTLAPMLGFHLPYDATQESFLDSLKDLFPDTNYYEVFKKVINDIDCNEKLIPLIEQMTLEALNPKDMSPNEFAKKWGAILYHTRAKAKRRPPADGGVSDDQQAMLDDIYQMWIKYSSMMKGKFLKTDLFDTRKRRYSNEKCYNFIQAKYPKLTIETIEKYIKDYKK